MNEAYYLFDGDLNKDSITTLLNFIKDNKGNIRIGIDSGGGVTFMSRFLLSALNEHKDRIHISGIYQIGSAAFDIFYHFKGRKSLSIGCHGYVHYGVRDITYNWDKKVPNRFENWQVTDVIPVFKDWYTNWFAEFLKPEEIEIMNTNHEVYLSFDRMKEIFPDAEIF